MTESHTPHKGDLVYYKGQKAGFVISIDGNLCWCDYSFLDGVANPFIWRFKDGVNVMHDWPTKPGSKPASCPGDIDAAWTVYK